jgi:hypothetical protein
MNTALDLDGNGRIDNQSVRVDMGCYEFVPPPQGTAVMIR